MQNTELQNPAESDLKKTNKRRNYELDFLKLVFAVFVFWSHTSALEYSGTKITLPPMLGRAAVHFYFILSGMFMANSIIKRNYTGNEPGKAAITFVMKKFKALALNWGTALVICAVVTRIAYHTSFEALWNKLVRSIPELLLIQSSSTYMLNRPAWYIAAMFFCMLPLAYMLFKKRDFTVNVLAPLASISLYLYMWNTDKGVLFFNYDVVGVFTGGILDAFCGLSFGICAYSIYTHINKNANRNVRVMLTIAEVALYGIFFAAWFALRKEKSVMAALPLLPIAIAITFSGQSYLVRLFEFKWMRYFAPLSLTIFLNHRTARVIVIKYFPGRNFTSSVLLMVLFTEIVCFLSFLIVTLLKLLWEKKLKTALTKSDLSEVDMPESDVIEPDMPEPDLTEVDMTEPDMPEPDMPEPDMPESDMPESDMTESDMTEVDMTNLDFNNPDLIEPDEMTKDE